MRRLLPTVETCVNLFIERLTSTSNDGLINIYMNYKRLTMNVICKFLFYCTKIQRNQWNFF